MDVDVAASKLEALGNPTRLLVYRALVRAGDPGLSVGQLLTQLGVPASTLSHHIKTLMMVGLMSQERRSTSLICRANYGAMQSLLDYLVAECCAGAACGIAPAQVETK
ncbi:MAG: ArsR family transcriptional regulator [Gammaproteobacteria bacterium]|jgi:ArsR family transcriptional regulator